MSLNKAILIGRVGKNPEIRYLGDGENYKIAKFTLATNEWFRNREGKHREITVWHNIAAWNASADYVEKYVRKGTLLYVEGPLRYRSWTDGRGVEHSSYGIYANEIRILASADDGKETPARENTAGEPRNDGIQDESETVPDDGLPF